MFEYFPANYAWSLSAHMAVNMGAALSEVDEICGPLKPLAAQGEAHAQEWFDSWRGMGERMIQLGSIDEEKGWGRAAGRKYLRAATYLLMAERQILTKSEATQLAYQAAVDFFKRGADLFGSRVERVEVPFGEASLPALFVPAEGTGDDRAPTLIHFSGLDVNKETIYLLGAQDLPRHGISVLICDHPGVGESLRFRGMHATYQSEIPATACVDYLETRGDVDSERIGICALSLGGYYAPRAAAFEPRLKCCICWGAIWSIPELFRWLGDQENPATSVPLDDQFQWVLGACDHVETHRMLEDWELAPVMDRITCPILIVHGENDRQASVEFARRTYEAAVNSSRRELKIMKLSEGGAEHCHADNPTMGNDYQWSWAAEVLGAYSGGGVAATNSSISSAA